jgi:hypothetical protein
METETEGNKIRKIMRPMSSDEAFWKESSL